MRNMALPTILLMLLAAGATAYAECSCAIAKIANGWCEDCKVGYISAVRIESKKLYDALQGKPVANTSEISCATCRKAASEDGVCQHCRVAFVQKKAYKSMPAYRLARGQATDPAKITCPVCRAAASDRGWCDGCKVGFVGNRSFKDKDAYNEAVKAREILLLAAEASQKCEACAVALVTDGTCTTCKVSFKDGRKITAHEKKTANP